MREIDELVEEQLNDTVYDMQKYFEENFNMEYATVLSAKITHQKKDASYSDVMMYATIAVASIAVIALQVKTAIDNKKKFEAQVHGNDVFQRLI